MAKEDVYLTPTLSCYGIMLRKPYETFLSADCRDKSVEVMQDGLTALKVANEAGVTICYGSDLLISMHALQTGTFILFVRELALIKYRRVYCQSYSPRFPYYPSSSNNQPRQDAQKGREIGRYS
jgi:hypothetical protein